MQAGATGRYSYAPAVPDPARMLAVDHAAAASLVSPGHDAVTATRRIGFAGALGLIALAGFVLRVIYAAAALRDEGPMADGLYYAAQAEVIADGRWFDHPFQPGTPAADHPPLNALVLSMPARLFGGDFMAMRITLCLVGATTIVLVGLLARRFAQRARSLPADRVGLIAAGLTAVYANIWMNDAIMMAESVTGACVAAALVGTYVLLDRPAWPAAVVLGGVIGLGALARAELTLLGPLVAVPAIVLTTQSWRARLARTAACAAAALLVIAPWAAYNLTRFDRPTLLSTGEGHVTAGANCPSTYHGRAIGYWSFECAFAEPDAPVDVDQSELSAWYGDHGAEYRREHLGRLPVVMGARVARLWSVGWVGQMASVNEFEGRPRWASLLGVVSFWALVPFAVAGAVMARRRGLVAWPLLTLPILVTGLAAWYYGSVRFRLPAEITIVVLAALTLAELRERRRGPTTAPTAAGG